MVSLSGHTSSSAGRYGYSPAESFALYSFSPAFKGLYIFIDHITDLLPASPILQAYSAVFKHVRPDLFSALFALFST